MKNELFKTLVKNEELLEMGENGELNLSLDIQSMSSLLGIKN